MTGWMWSWKGLTTSWGGALALASTLLFLGLRQGRWKFYWLLPDPNGLRSIGSIYRTTLSSRPLESTAVLIVLSLAFVLTIMWMGARIWHQFA
ncbi:MAG TPA: hypothetical protein VFK13_13295 [Gemmatimonadaceae bacterium]|nr:hypothetical protein [Gemmatimonadaceae bacterium]